MPCRRCASASRPPSKRHRMRDHGFEMLMNISLQCRSRWLNIARQRWSMLLASVVAGGLLWRITCNIDLSDESYYAIFIHDWLIVGVRASTLATLHQTAALIVYPAAALYVKVIGGMSGLMLFLRCLYVAGSLVAALFSFLFIRHLRGSDCAWLAAAALIAFIPFGLPAPSYNTLGLQGMTTALACFGLAANRAQAGLSRSGWTMASALAWAVSVIAYPTLGLPFGLFCLALLLTGRTSPGPGWIYVLATTITVSLGLAIITFALTPTKLYESVSYLNKINDVAGLRSKIDISLGMITSQPDFEFLLAGMLAIGFLRPSLPVQSVCIVSGAALLALQLEKPVFFMRSHDAMTLMALSGIGLLFGLRSRATPEDRTVALITLASLAAGVTTAATATNGAFNFCIGCAPAAVLTLAAPRCTTRLARTMRAGVQTCLVLVVALSSVSVLYGDSPSDDQARIRIRRGIFAGLSVQASQAHLIDFASHLDGMDPGHRTIVEFGRYPGLTLATDDQFLALTAFALQPNVSASGFAATEAFYDDPSHRPSLVILAADQFTGFINPMRKNFGSWYKSCNYYSEGSIEIDVFCRSKDPS